MGVTVSPLCIHGVLFCSSWGESVFIGVQVVGMLLLVFHSNHQILYFMVLAPIYAALVWSLTSALPSMALLSTLQASVIPLMVVSR